MNYDRYINQAIAAVPPSGIRRFFDIAATMKDAISLGVGEPDFVTPYHIRNAAINSIIDGGTQYTGNRGLPELCREISEYLSERFHTDYDPKTEIMVTVGASEAIDIALRALVGPGDEVLVPQPSYVSYSPSVIFAGGTPVGVETTADTEFRLTPEALRAAITPRTKCLILPYPNNPTGGIMEKVDLEKIAQVVRETGILVISDEIYGELTYGDRTHETPPDYAVELARVIRDTFTRGGNLVIPAFSVGRTQEMLYFLREIKEKGLVKGHGNFPVYIDSPLATEATRIFRDTDPGCFDAQTRALLEKGIDPINVPGLRISVTSEDSRMINTDRTPKVILSASGMCEAGRIRHHLKHNLWRKECTILFVGYQAVGTPGRKIVEKASKITLFGEDMDIAARIYTINGFSAHAGQDQLLSWLEPLVHDKANVVLVHGEEKAQTTLSGLIKEKFGVTPLVPGYMEEMILEGHQVAQTVQHEALAHPRINWDFLTGEVERKWGMFKGKLADVEQSPWVQQTELQDALAKMDYALTRLLSRM